MGLVFIADLPLVSPIGIGGLCPSVGGSLGGAAVTLSASLTGALALNASFSASPPTVATYFTGLELLVVPVPGVSGALTFGAALPNVPYGCSFGVDVSAGISLNASITANITASLNVGLPNLSALLSASIGCYAFTYTGAASGLGAALTTELATSWPDGAPSSGACNAIILVAPTSVASVLLAFLDGLGTPPAGLFFVAKLSALSQLSLSTSAAMPQASAALNAQLSACASINASLTPKIAVALPTLQATAGIVVSTTVPNLKAQLNLKPPSVSVAISATAKLAAGISANFGAMAALGLTLSRYDALFGVYTYSGTGTAFGAAVTAEITDPSNVTAIVLATTDSLSFGVLTSFFGGAL